MRTSLEGEQPISTETVFAKFPFKPHVLRAGEPPYPDYDPTALTGAGFTLGISPNVREWYTWAMSRPDAPLLMADYSQRADWAIAYSEGKTLPEATLRTWQELRLFAANLVAKWVPGHCWMRFG